MQTKDVKEIQENNHDYPWVVELLVILIFFIMFFYLFQIAHIKLYLF